MIGCAELKQTDIETTLSSAISGVSPPYSRRTRRRAGLRVTHKSLGLVWACPLDAGLGFQGKGQWDVWSRPLHPSTLEREGTGEAFLLEGVCLQ